ncbi:aryl-alcohol dehydrogenase-like predicted oxidoreductase [Conyzicola lurida]|uniref:Aryl-alcohol dehydrogenase-like predicted oxidoreductase n=1 Tax=Conyzicola lurida TaxID=1172621 RepID=A0A841AM30_9MICO|nr:aldo/keto reductase [Conyzicola lurida]MBB5842791.1 aryl-alcohol dehydrogenase-like predicted oxidoreductase [Conyzicola lurida]
MTTAIDTDRPQASARSLHRRVGLSDLHVFPLAISGNVFGWTSDVMATNGVLDAYADAGGNFVDTADSYAAGRSEIMIGNWMRDRRNRPDMVVATKVGKSGDNPGLSARAVTASVHASLERLRTGYIDLLYLHIDDDTVPFEETLFAVDELIRAGKVRYFGGSDHTGNRLIEARIAAAQMGLAPMVALQNHYNLLHRTEYEGDLARVADRQGLGVMPRFALGSGFLTGKYRSRADIAKNERGAEAAKYFNRRGLRVLACLDRIAAAQQSSPGSIALAWLLSKPHVVAPVASASHPEQVADLVAAARVQLTRTQVAELDKVSA